MEEQRSEKRAKTLAIAVVTVLLSLTTFIGWNVHVSTEFKGENSKHSMTIDNFNAVSSEKTPEIKAEIVDRFVEAVFSLDSLATRGILLFHLLALAAYMISRFLNKKWALLKVLLWMDVAIVLYYIGILAMFILTMPTDEALILAGFERYASSIVVLLIGVLGLCVVHDIENSFHVQRLARRDSKAFKSLLTKNIYEMSTIGLIALSVTILLSEVNGMTSMKHSYEASTPGKVQQLVGDHWLDVDERKYLMYASDTDQQISSFYLQYAARYFLFAPHVDAVYTVEHFPDQLEPYDYLIILEADEAMTEFVAQYGINGDDITGVYPIAEVFHNDSTSSNN